MNRRRNEKSVPPLQSRKAEMTSGITSSSAAGSNQNKPSANPQLPGLSGARPTRSCSSSSIADGPLPGSVAAQPASRVESTNNVLSRPSTLSSLPSNHASKKVTSARNTNHSKPARISTATTSSAFASPRPFHPSVRVSVADNPDLKPQSQGSTVAINHGSSEFVDGAAAAGLADAATTDSSSPSPSHSVCDRDTNYVVFDYPQALDEPDHYSQVVVNQEEKVTESHQQQDRDVMGTYPDVAYSADKSPDDGSSADIARHHLKEDDLLDDFFKFVSNGMCLPFFFFAFPFESRHVFSLTS